VSVAGTVLVVAAVSDVVVVSVVLLVVVSLRWQAMTRRSAAGRMSRFVIAIPFRSWRR
jgi:hypothetical protein